MRIWEHNKKTILFVTHSVDEAIYLPDKIIVMSSSSVKIKEIIDIDMKRLRNRGYIRYAKLTGQILKILEL